MKKLISVLLALSLMFSFSVVSYAASSPLSESELQEKYKDLAGTSINVYNWGEYISDGSEGTMNVNEEFEKLTGIKVNYTTYSTNEDMYTKLKSGGAAYDIVIPSDYMIQRLIDEGYLQKINFDNIPNYKNIMDEYKGLYFDPQNEYSVPYNVGMVGVIYNKTVVKGNPTSWSLMWDEEYKGQILQFNNPRDGFASAMFLLGIDVNTEDKAEWKRAYQKLVEQKDVLQSYVSDEIYNKMEAGDAAIAAYYAGDYLLMKENNPDLEFYYPEEGTNIFVDSMCIPKSSRNKEAAELYINFLLSEEVALANAEYLYYATPNKAVINNDNYSLKGNPILYPAKEDMPKTQYYHNLDQETLSLMTSLWSELKIEGTSNTAVYIGLGTTAGIGLAAIVYVTIRKKKREKLYDE
ncbi:MAG: spermidine/putrescine ABC transporter substrate-binding protein [Ruminococcaceae bacterium]|nr:spermidine/putrescine ABC transporter substrate-binding protein [Oscillospiraceae bacterium]